MPKKENLTHLSGNSIKNYIDAIARKIRVIENQKLTTSSFYGNWSWSTDNQYQILRDTISKKVSKEDKQFRGKKEKSQNLSDSITSRSWRVLINKTLEKRDRFRELGDLPSFIKTNASVCVHIITYFCGCRAQQEVADSVILILQIFHKILSGSTKVVIPKRENLPPIIPLLNASLVLFLDKFTATLFEFF